MKDLTKSYGELGYADFLISHDLRESIRMIRTYLGLHEDEYGATIEPKAKTYLGYATEGAVRLSGLVEAFDKFNRLRTQPLDIQPSDLNLIVQGTFQSLDTLLRENGAKIIYPAPLPTVRCDPKQISSLFLNLLANAIKFHKPNQPPTIRIESHVENGNVRISINDNGMGIKPRDRDKIFEPFCRLNSRTEYPGLGIGLATCKRIAEAHGAALSCSSEYGVGSTFTFTLPRCENQP